MGGVKKWRYFYTFSAPKTCFSRRRRRREKFLSTFFEIFVTFVNKNAIKSDFWVICVEVSRKFSKNPHFWQKSISTNFEIFESISTEVGSPPQIALMNIVTWYNYRYEPLYTFVRCKTTKILDY